MSKSIIHKKTTKIFVYGTYLNIFKYYVYEIKIVKYFTGRIQLSNQKNNIITKSKYIQLALIN